MKKVNGLRLTMFLLTGLLLFVWFPSCNNAGKSKETTDTSTVKDATSTAEDTTSASQVIMIDGDTTYADEQDEIVSEEKLRSNKLYILLITKAQLIEAFNGEKKNRMLKFRFTNKDDVWTMYAYPTNKGGHRTDLKKIYLTVASQENYVEIGKDDLKYREIISRGQVKKYLNTGGIGDDVAIDPTKLSDIWLIPCRANNGKIVFYMASPKTSGFKCPKGGDGDLNPSPPDNPCTEFGCDEGYNISKADDK